MFNAPRPAQRYHTATNSFGGSYVDENPLAGSAYDGLDPWSAAPSPSPPPGASGPSALSSVIADATVPSIYEGAFAAVDTNNSGEASVNALSRVLSTSLLPASTVDRIVNLVNSRGSRVSKLEFFVALALVALAQLGKDVSIEQVAALAQHNDLPEPTLDLASVHSTSTITSPPAVNNPAQYSSDDPWNTAGRYPTAGGNIPPSPGGVTNGVSSVSGTGLPQNWWKRQEAVAVNIGGQQGFILNRYTVYEISTDRGATVTRRYSEFTFLWDVLVRRYPFRILPALPPKRLGPDETFLEQRRRGLSRFLNFVVNHPVIKDDGFLAVFLTEPSLETWRKHSAISMEEESATKRIDRIEEMTIPSDLEEKLAVIKSKISPLIEQWQRICILAERIIKRREAAAVRSLDIDTTSSLWAHLPSLASFDSLLSSLTGKPLNNATNTTITHAPAPVANTIEQADTARLTNTLKVLVEVNERCWRGDGCELCGGVRQGLSRVATHTQTHSDLLDQRTRTLLYTTLEALKGQRDLYVAMRDLFIRHDRLSHDQVDRLRKRSETNALKLESVRAAQKENWQDEVDKLTISIQKDNATVTTLLNRRIFIRASMWHEVRVVLHNRENALVTQAVQTFAREEQAFAYAVHANWASMEEALEGMPLE